MRQPTPPDPIEQLADWLAFAVPLRIPELEHRLAAGGISEAWLMGAARRAGMSLGGKGDSVLFSPRAPRTGRARDTVARTVGDLVDGVAAAALFAGPDGVTVLGQRYRPSPPARPPTAEQLAAGRRIHQLLDELEALAEEPERPAARPGPSRADTPEPAPRNRHSRAEST